MDASASALNSGDRANELYWGSRMSVNQIADALDLSKGALYEMIRPLAAQVACPSCGVEAVHPNRTAKEKGLIACPDCGWGEAEGSVAPTSAAAAPLRPPAGPRGRPAAPGRPDEGSAPRNQAGVAAGILLGAAAGLALFLWARRR